MTRGGGVPVQTKRIRKSFVSVGVLPVQKANRPARTLIITPVFAEHFGSLPIGHILPRTGRYDGLGPFRQGQVDKYRGKIIGDVFFWSDDWKIKFPQHGMANFMRQDMEKRIFGFFRQFDFWLCSQRSGQSSGEDGCA